MIRFIISSIFMLVGLAIIFVTLIGNFRFGFVLNRMQVGAVADTFGALFVVIALVIAKGFDIITLKLVMTIIFMWFANPVASHFLAKTEIISNEKIMEECEVIIDDDLV